MKMWSLALGGVVFLILGLGLLFPKELLTPLRFLGAAIGQIDIPTLRLWQSLGGFVRTLVGGSSGTDVSLVQRSFATDPSIYPQGIVSGYWGSFTQSAFLRFQNEYQLAQTGIFDAATREILNRLFYQQLCPVADTSSPDLSLIHVTRKNGLPQSYIPTGLVDISALVRTSGIICVQQSTADALVNLFRAARTDGISLRVCSGYRGPNIQNYVLNQWLAIKGTLAFNEVAQPYHSEHQIGTAIDLTGSSVEYSCSTDNFASTLESVWLTQNAWRYGFNLSYPATFQSGSANEYIYEPWHWRYFGIPLATELYTKNISYNELSEAPQQPVSTSTIIRY